MILIFKGQQFKYEIEAVVKLFFPVVHFDFIYDGELSDADGDFCFSCRKQNGGITELSVECRVGDRMEADSGFLEGTADDGQCELKLCALIFGCLSKMTGKTPAWGILTGVRPVKRINAMLAQGCSESEIYEILKRDLLCSDGKIRLACETAATQKEIIKHTGRENFSLYVSIPFCPSRCAYCSFVSQEVERSLGLIPTYVSKLCREIERTGEIAAELGLKLQSVYFGGGTPTAIDAVYLKTLMQAVERSFDCSSVKEYTVEAGRADTITEEKLQVIKEMGADRISINPQTLNDSVLKAIGRKHTAEEFFEKYRIAKKVGFRCINTDIIAGLPTDTPESFAATIDGIMGLSPENITVHTLSVKRTSNINSKDGEGIKAAEGHAAGMTELSSVKLREKGYRPYYLYRQKNMVDNLENVGWSLPGYESLYNVVIMEEIQTILAVGAGASTKLVDSENGRLERIYNRKLPLEYIRNFDSELEKKKDIERFCRQ